MAIWTPTSAGNGTSLAVDDYQRTGFLGGSDALDTDNPEIIKTDDCEIALDFFGTGIHAYTKWSGGSDTWNFIGTWIQRTAGVLGPGAPGGLAEVRIKKRFLLAAINDYSGGGAPLIAIAGPTTNPAFAKNILWLRLVSGSGTGSVWRFDADWEEYATGSGQTASSANIPYADLLVDTDRDILYRVQGCTAGQTDFSQTIVDGSILVEMDGVEYINATGIDPYIHWASGNPSVRDTFQRIGFGLAGLLGPIWPVSISDEVTVSGVTPDMPTDESAQCCASDAVEGSGVAAPGAGVDRSIEIDPTWTPRLEGGAVNPTEPPLTDPETWSENLHRLGRVSVTLAIRKYPNELGTATYRFSTQKIPGKVGVRPYSRPHVVSYGDVTRSVSSLDGPVAVPSWTVRLDDKQGLLRGLLADPTTNGLEQGRWEVTATIASEDALTQELEERILFRGVAVDAIPEPGRGFSLETRSIIGGHLKGYDLDKKIPLPTLGQCFGSLAEFPEANRKIKVDLAYGENSDHGTVDLAGNIAEKGLKGARYCGKRLISDGLPGTPPTAPVYLGQVTNLQCVVTGSGPTMRVAIGVSLMTEFGETPPTVLVVEDYPEVTSGSHYATWTWDLPVAYADQIKYAVEYVGDRMTFPKYFLDGGGGVAYTPATSYVDDGDDSHTKGYRHGPVRVNTAQVAEGAPGVPASGPMFFDVWSVSIGVLNWDIVDFYGAVLEGNGTTVRGLLDASTANSGIRNVEIIAPGDALYPDADPWYTDDLGNRQSVFYSRGARSLQAINGNVGFALNIGGQTEEPDGTGPHFTEAGEVLLHCLTNWWGLDPTTPIYSDGATWNDYPRFANGDCKLDVAGFKTFQADTATAMANDRGAQARFILGGSNDLTLRELLAQFYWSFYGRIEDNHFGQLGPVRLPHGLSATGTIFRDRLEIRRWLAPQIDRRVITEATYLYDQDYEMQVWRRKPDTLVDDDALDANDGEPLTRETIEMPLTGDPLTARVSAYYFRELFKRPRRWQPFEASYRALETDTADPLRVTHYDGLGSTGETLTQMWLDRHAVQPSRERVVLTGLDISALTVPTIPGLSPLGDEDAMTVGNLGDEESIAAPPLGAYELVDENA